MKGYEPLDESGAGCAPDHLGRRVLGICKSCYNRYRYERFDGDAQRRRRWIKQGIDPDEAEVLWNSVGGCQLCGSTRRLAIDHDHETGQIRGKLCGSCNVGIGMFEDDPDLVEKAARYLRGW